MELIVPINPEIESIRLHRNRNRIILRVIDRLCETFFTPVATSDPRNSKRTLSLGKINARLDRIYLIFIDLNLTVLYP